MNFIKIIFAANNFFEKFSAENKTFKKADCFFLNYIIQQYPRKVPKYKTLHTRIRQGKRIFEYLPAKMYCTT